jgi:hypothetical protein
MLTFVLAVTTYLFFKKADEAQKAVDAKQKEASEANTKRLEAEKNRIQIVKEVLGLPEDTGNPEILELKQDAIDDVYGKYLEEPTYTAALKWLSSSIQEHYESMQGLQAEKDRFAEEKKQLAEKHVAEMNKLTDSRKAAQDELDKLRADKTAYENENTKQKNALEKNREAADAESKRLRLLGEEIAKGKRYLSSERQKTWPADAPAEGDKAEADTGRDERRVALMLDELRERERTIFRLNEVLAKLRVADPALQNTVRSATPKDDRVDGFDGRILSVNELDRTVLVACGTTSGLRAGLMFDVYDPTDPRPQLGSNKAVVEVVAIESDSLVRCRFRKDSILDPVVPGDVVATSLWSPGTPLEVVIVGVVQLGGNPEGDRKRLEQLVERIGGTIAETVSPSTTMVVDAGVPQVKGSDAEASGPRKKMTEKEKKFRDDQIREAKQQGIKVMAFEPFLDSLGLQVESVRSNRLPVPVNPQAAPARSENIAF